MSAVRTRAVDGYGDVPEVLLQLEEQLRALGGLSSEGVFRVAASKARVVALKASLDAGAGLVCDSCHTAANAIKQWFRELPTALFNPMDPALMMLGEQGAAPALDSLAPVLRSTTLWLLDLLCTVADNEADTRMDAHNLAIVFSPNLYVVSSENPMVVYSRSSEFTAFFEKVLQWRRASRGA